MSEEHEENELFRVSQLIILIGYSFFSVLLSVEAFLLSWEKWAVLLVLTGIAVGWLLHLQQHFTPSNRLWIYSVLMMATFFFYGTHETSTFDLALVMSVVIALYTMTGVKKLITLCQTAYYITMAYELITMILRGAVFDSLDISRILLHLLMIMMAGMISRIIIDKWESMQRESKDEIEFLKDSTDRLDDFLANVSHEIRTPVNAVVGLSGVCIGRERDRGKLEDLKAIQRAGKRVAEQITDILDYSEIDRGILARYDEDYILESILQDIVTQIRMYKKPETELILDVNPAIPAVMNSDAGKLKRILWHLIMNALKYTYEGAVYVRISCSEESYGINLNIEVTDTGIGMTMEELSRVRERFYQADSGRSRQESGLGLGIPIAAGFVSLLGGFMTIDSVRDEGTTVRVSIPQKITDPRTCMALTNRERLCIGGLFDFDKFPNPHVREYYNRMLGNIVRGMNVQMHRVENAENLRKLVSSINLTHLFVGTEEYMTDPEYIEKLTREMLVVLVADSGFALPAGSRIRLMEKPFYCFPVIQQLNSKPGDDEREVRMTCPGIRALVVDDEPMNLIVAKGIFSGYGMSMVSAESGEEAIELCTENRFDIIFMDHMMPGMDGIETVKRLHSEKLNKSADTPIVALTANAVSTAREMFMSAGFDGFVSKPIELAELERVLKKVLPKNAIVYGDGSENTARAGDEWAMLDNSGIDTERGLHYSQGDEELYKVLLKRFIEEAEAKKTALSTAYKEGDNKNYEVFVHALKSTSKMIGAAELSDQAKELEELAKAGGQGITGSLHDRMMEMYMHVVDVIREALEGMPDVPSEPADALDGSEVLEFAPVQEGEE